MDIIQTKTVIVTTILLLFVVAAGVAMATAWKPIGRTPRGERLERIKRSPNYHNGEFHNRIATPMMTSGKSRWCAMLDYLFSKKPDNQIPESLIPSVKTDLSKLDLRKDQMVWFGHSSYLLVNNGVTFLVDPVLTSQYPVSLMMKPFKGSDIYTPDDIPSIDYLIITHDHYDHLDYATVKELKNRIGKVICPLGVGEHFEYWGYSPNDMIEMDWNEVADLSSGLRVTCLPARHFSGRFLKKNPTLWASFMVEGTTVAYIGGDSGYGSHFAEIGKLFSEIDVAMIEDGQYNEDWKCIHTLPDQLSNVIHDLSPHLVIPVHNGKFALSTHTWDEPVNKIKKLADSDSTIRLSLPVIGRPIEF